MNFFNLHLLSTYLKKWSYNENKVTFNYSYCCEIGYDRSHIDMRLSSPVNMVNEFLNNVFHRAKEKINEHLQANAAQTEADEMAIAGNGSNIILVNEPEVKRKLSIFFSKILKEFNNNKRSRGRSRIISTRSLDFYYNDFEYEPLSDEIKFYVHLNRGLNKINGDLYSNAVDDLKNALAFKPEDPTANKNIAKALMKLGKFEEAVKHLEVYTQAEKSDVALHQLAQAFMRLGYLDKAEEIYKQIEKEFPGSLYAPFGLAQINYKKGKGFKQKLDRVYKENPEWLAEHLRNEWSYSLPGYEEDEDVKWNAATAARYLGFKRPFDLTRKAFNNELPSYFDSEKGTIRFVKPELDAWVDLVNRYKLEPQNYQTHEDLLTEQEKQKAQRKKGRRPKKTESVKEQVA